MEEYGVLEFDELSLDQIWDLFINLGVCSEETLQVITSINGYNLETMKDVLYVTTGLRSLEQVVEEYGLNPDDDPDLFYFDGSVITDGDGGEE